MQVRSQFVKIFGALAIAMLAFATSADAQPRIAPPGGGNPPGPAPQSGGSAAGVMENGTTAEITMEAMKAAGYAEVAIYQTKDGTRNVSGKVHGMLVSATHYACQNGACGVVVYVVGFGKQDSIDANYMNTWNSRSFFSSLHVDGGELFFNWGVFTRGTTVTHLALTAAVFGNSLKSILAFKP